MLDNCVDVHYIILTRKLILYLFATVVAFLSPWAGKVGGKSFHLYLCTANLIGKREVNKLGLCCLFEPVALLHISGKEMSHRFLEDP